MGGRRGRRPKATARVSPAAEPQQTGGGALPRRAGETTPRADHRPDHDSDAIARIATADEDARPRDWTNDKLVDALVDAYVHAGRHGVMPPATALPVEVRSRLTSGLACAHPAHRSWIANLLEDIERFWQFWVNIIPKGGIIAYLMALFLKTCTPIENPHTLGKVPQKCLYIRARKCGGHVF